MTDEKRRFSRFQFNMKAELKVDENTYQVDKIENLSVGGCLLKIPSLDYAPDYSCSLKIILQVSGNEPNVDIEGKLIRCEKGAVAVRFTSINMESLYHLQNIARFNADDPDRIEQEIKEHPGLV